MTIYPVTVTPLMSSRENDAFGEFASEFGKYKQRIRVQVKSGSFTEPWLFFFQEYRSQTPRTR